MAEHRGRCGECSVTWDWRSGPAVKQARCGYCDGRLRSVRVEREGDQGCRVEEWHDVEADGNQRPTLWRVVRS